MSMMSAFIEVEKTAHDIALLCRLLEVAHSSFDAWRHTATPGQRRRPGARDHRAVRRLSVVTVSVMGCQPHSRRWRQRRVGYPATSTSPPLWRCHRDARLGRGDSAQA